jgi:flagellar biosynthesis/type III secretory pathway chaperone
MIDQLIQVISDEAVLFEEFLRLLDRQKEVLVANDTDGLTEVTAELNQKLSESKLLNRRREEVIAAVKKANAIDGDVTVTRLLEYADRDQSERLSQLQQTILGLNDSITQARNTNAMLLNRSREFISRTMNMLSRLHSPDRTYGRDGAAPQATATIAVDRRV